MKTLKILMYLADHRFGSDVYELAEMIGASVRHTWRLLKQLQEAGIFLVGLHSGRKRLAGGVKRNIRLMDRARARKLCGMS